ncbi:MAG: hypothetical protein EXR31_10420 [Betaproteobacteria bacterium]|nr:hypothetical protein [Betaproteobacteria bacterium]
MIRMRGLTPPPLNFAGTLPQFWTPMRFRRFGAYRARAHPLAREGAPYGAQPPGPPPSPAAAVREIVQTFTTQGEGQALVLAARHGPAYSEGARYYVTLAGDTEEQLAQLAATLGARIARSRPARSQLVICKLFLDARLYEVRQARSNGHTPPQAVLDKPVIAAHGIPRWVPLAALALSGIGLVISLSTRGGR